MQDYRSLEYDLECSSKIKEKCRISYRYSQALYAALCNNDWCPTDTMALLKNQTWNCSWRYAGSLVSRLIDDGSDYLSFYCSGSFDDDGGVAEGTITEEIQEDLKELGWICLKNT